MKNSAWIQDYLLDIIEPLSKKLFFWETDPIRIGKLIRIVHNISIYSLTALFITVHTIYPSYILLWVVYILCFLIWIHHVITGGCLISKLEQKLIGDTSSFVDPILEIFNIPITPESTSGVLTLSTTIFIFMLSLELCARTVLNIKSYMPFRFFS
jgi:hypothetical protein